MNDEIRQYTRHELLIAIRNEQLKKLCACEIDLKVATKSSILSPDSNQAKEILAMKNAIKGLNEIVKAADELIDIEIQIERKGKIES